MKAKAGWYATWAADTTWAYTPEQEKAILAALPLADPAKGAEALRAVMGAAQHYRGFAQTLKERPTLGIVKGQLNSLAEQAQALAHTLGTLDQRAYTALLIAGAGSFPMPDLERQLTNLQIAALRAAQDLKAGGAPRNDALRLYVNDLVRVWREYAPPGVARCYVDREDGKRKGNLNVFLDACALPVLGPTTLCTAAGFLKKVYAAYRAGDNEEGNEEGNPCRK